MLTFCFVFIAFFLQGFDLQSHEFEFAFESGKMYIETTWSWAFRRYGIGQKLKFISETIEIVLESWPRVLRLAFRGGGRH